MSRQDRVLLKFIVWLAVGTFLFGIWAIVVGLRRPPPAQNQPSPAATNAYPAASATR